MNRIRKLLLKCIISFAFALVLVMGTVSMDGFMRTVYANEPQEMTSTTTEWSGNYTVNSSIWMSDKDVNVKENTTITIASGAKFDLNRCTIIVNNNKTLNIDGMGELMLKGRLNSVPFTGNLSVNGGKVIITGNINNNDGGAGVKGSLIVNGGTVVITGCEGSSQHDGGTGVDGNVTVNGGTVTVSGGEGKSNDDGFSLGGTGINGKVNLSGGTLTVSGGKHGGYGLGYNSAYASTSTLTVEEGHYYTFDGANGVYTGVLYGGTDSILSNEMLNGKTLQPAKQQLTIPTSFTGGTVTADKTGYVPIGATVTLTVTPDSGYELSTLTVTGDTSHETVTVSGTGNTRTFTMPSENVTVSATFTQIPVKYLDESGTQKFCPSYTVLKGGGMTRMRSGVA